MPRAALRWGGPAARASVRCGVDAPPTTSLTPRRYSRRPMEAARFERNVRTESSEIFTIYGGARRIGRVDIHYGRFEVHGTLLLEVDLTDDELQQLIDQLDEELVQTHDPEREDFLVTVFKSEELGFYSDEFESDDDEDDEP